MLFRSSDGETEATLKALAGTESHLEAGGGSRILLSQGCREGREVTYRQIPKAKRFRPEFKPKKKKKRIRYRVLSLRLGRMSFRLAGGR